MKAALATPVVKMHGAENTFVLLDERPARFDDYAELARRVCDPSGPLDGADGLLVLHARAGFAAEMLIFNADGSEAEMCGNGVRCAARYLFERGAGERFTLATAAGPIGVAVVAADPFAARIDLGPVSFPGGAREETIEAAGTRLSFYDVSVGNPHAVWFVPDVNAIDLATLGAALQRSERFPDGTNLHVVQQVDEATIRVRHFERGVGLTQACGTGAAASAAAAIALRGGRSPVAVLVPGGTLGVEWAPGSGAVLTGPAETIFARTIWL